MCCACSSWPLWLPWWPGIPAPSTSYTGSSLRAGIIPWGPTTWAGMFCRRIMYGARISLMVGFVAVGIATAIGVVLGALAGYYGGWVDALLMRFVDIMLCFPTFFLILAVIAFLEPSIWNIMIIIGLTSWMGVTRLVRAEFLSLRERDFVLAARALGASDCQGHLSSYSSQRPVAGPGLGHSRCGGAPSSPRAPSLSSASGFSRPPPPGGTC